MVVTMKEQKKTFKYQETMNLYIDNISSKKQPFWRPIYEVTENSYFEETKLFPTIVLNQCINNPNQTQNRPNEVKAANKSGHVTGVLFTSGYDPPKGVR